MPKQDTQESESKANTNPTGAVSFGKVLGSIQGLQQRLGDFSYADIALAEARVRSLVKQLSSMRDDLAEVIHLKQAIIDTNQRISDLPKDNFDLVSLDSLAKHPQLHAIVQTSKLIRIQRQIKAVRATSDVASVTSDTGEPNATASGIEQLGTESPSETRRANRVIAVENSGGLSGNTVTKPAIEDTVSLSGKTDQTTLDESFPADIGHSSFAAPSFEIPPNESDQSQIKPSDWTFDLHETIAQSSGVSAARVEFDFSAETASEQEIAVDETPASSVVLPASPTDTEAPVTVQSLNPVQAGEAIPRINPEAKPVEDATPVKLEVSRALVPAGFDFDQRLLEDVIKNYGDFAITPNLPAIFEDPKPAAPMVARPPTELPPEVEKPLAAERNVPKTQKAGDLDRQLKKIIKDYGEYDLYSKQSSINLKTGGIAAFAVLGLVLAGLYFFKSPTPPNGPQARPAPRPAAASSAPAVIAPSPAKNDVKAAPAQGTDAANTDTRPSVDPEQRP